MPLSQPSTAGASFLISGLRRTKNRSRLRIARPRRGRSRSFEGLSRQHPEEPVPVRDVYPLGPIDFLQYSACYS